jgi:hypothetical protein
MLHNSSLRWREAGRELSERASERFINSRAHQYRGNENGRARTETDREVSIDAHNTCVIRRGLLFGAALRDPDPLRMRAAGQSDGRRLTPGALWRTLRHRAARVNINLVLDKKEEPLTEKTSWRAPPLSLAEDELKISQKVGWRAALMSLRAAPDKRGHYAARSPNCPSAALMPCRPTDYFVASREARVQTQIALVAASTHPIALSDCFNLQNKRRTRSISWFRCHFNCGWLPFTVKGRIHDRDFNEYMLYDTRFH